MNKLSIELTNCYGIKHLKTEFDFASSKSSRPNVFAIYAPNGAMKSSFAQTFKDIADGKASKDRIFPERVCERTVRDENGMDLLPETVVVVSPYDRDCAHAEKTSTLLVDHKLRTEYEQLHLEVDRAETAFLDAMKAQSRSKRT